jgi:hypothetical protein
LGKGDVVFVGYDIEGGVGTWTGDTFHPFVVGVGSFSYDAV